MLERETRLGGREVVERVRRRGGVQGGPHVGEEGEGHVGAPEQAAAGEGDHQHNTVDHLEHGAGPARFVEEPVDVDEGGRQLHEAVLHAVVEAEGTLVEELVWEK